MIHRLRSVSLLWQLPLGLASLVFFKTVRDVVLLLGWRHFRTHPEEFLSWNILSRQRLEAPRQLLRTVVTAPRWNNHAVIASGGPVPVKHTVVMDAEALGESAGYWFLTAFAFPRFTATEHLSSFSHPKDAGPVVMTLPPGNYYISLRYYDPTERLRFPGIEVDGRELVVETEVPGDVNAFYQDLHRRSRLLYVCLHYYIYVALRWQRLLPAAWVKREVLPVGNADTNFLYGPLERGQALAFRCDPGVWHGHRVYVTTYNLASLPVLGFEVKEPVFTGPTCTQRGFYVVRVVRTTASLQREPAGTPTEIEVCPVPGSPPA